MVIFRIQKDLIKVLDLDQDKTYWPENVFRTNLSWEPILSVRCAKRKLKVTEIPEVSRKRIGGERKLQVIRGIELYGAGYCRDCIMMSHIEEKSLNSKYFKRWEKLL
jgi:hypothetical protein